MYPDQFPRNAWYVAARSAEVQTGRLLPRFLLGDPVVMYRAEDDIPVAMVDRCVHRQMPLSLGRLKGNQIECGYHGLTFASDGNCVRIPGSTRIADKVRVQTFPLVEGNGLIWIWMGDPDTVDPGQIPDHHWYTADGWTTAGGTLHMNARAQLLNENLLDLSHLTFLHPESIGSPEIADIPVSVSYDDRTVTVQREMTGVECPPFFTHVTGINQPIDRQQIAEFFAPAFHITTTALKPSDDTDESRMARQKTMHAITPETRTTTHYFWSVSRDYATEDQSVTDYTLEAVTGVFQQDIEACEAIEHIIAAWEPSYPLELNIKVDAGPLQSRKIIEKMLATEGATTGSRPQDRFTDAATRAAAQAWTDRQAALDS
ncbi:aromatic ring-hydroxylating dioxygenase subunit alpha [Prauserella halophila]|uniref:Aromatic ring-hydroxylating dioxygenase subunit alpha n=1 Tax=Prauserella halophila TaxID=185641 RepID=A0ABP4GTJ5_9PSEU|nr:aromatic ring-hydroxylating dioxygenase subunit alpha [Prauserella halophila]MCP2235778.1 vanillate O-demethylase monooxygenase subunit [Prauserella halophila]